MVSLLANPKGSDPLSAGHYGHFAGKVSHVGSGVEFVGHDARRGGMGSYPHGARTFYALHGDHPRYSRCTGGARQAVDSSQLIGVVDHTALLDRNHGWRGVKSETNVRAVTWRRSTWENALCTRLLARGSVGLASGRQARWPYQFRPGGRPDIVPAENPGCLHHSRWKSSVFVEYLIQTEIYVAREQLLTTIGFHHSEVSEAGVGADPFEWDQFRRRAA